MQVFWIIVGTGSVQLTSFSSTTATSQPSSTAKATTQQYGRKLLQSSGNSTSNSTIPAENVVFAVTLPSAAQNSLLVLQNSSPTVRQQFAGWFVTQMQSRGKSSASPTFYGRKRLLTSAHDVSGLPLWEEWELGLFSRGAARRLHGGR